MPKFIVSPHHRAGYYDGAQLYKPGEAVVIDPKEYGTKLPREGGLADYGPLTPTDREGALALGWSRGRVDAAFPASSTDLKRRNGR
ncbi:MAG TPA: hypothetical protein VKB92_13325 [Myxococcales bacterium]|nr:hypothetical protein [Myxococcales bacterium]